MSRAKIQRFHPLFALRYVKYGFVTCLVPMTQALLKWDIDALFTALWQDLYILLVFGAAAVILWYTTSFTLDADTVRIRQGVFVKKQYIFRTKSIAVLEIKRPLLYRMLGASMLTMYFKQQAVPRKFTLYLPKKTAQEAADTLMPARSDTSVFAPTGYERLAFVMLSANVLTACFFIVMTYNRASDFFGDDVKNLAQQNFSHITALLETYLPMGLAAFTSVCFVVASITILYSFFHTAGFRVCRNGGVLVMRGGFIEKTERRIYVNCITACDIRVTPVARLLRRMPVYITAGSFSGGDIPIMVVRTGQENAAQTLLPSFQTPSGELCVPARKSIVSYLWQPATVFGIFALLLIAAVTRMPNMLSVLAVPTLLAAASMAVSYEGYLREGVCKNENRTLSAVYTRYFTRHEVCVFTPDAAYIIKEQPFAISAGWCDFYISLPGSITFRVRGVMRYVADKIPFLV